jgi:glycosyltransferase involved in cell wall biosynthesis
MAMQGQLRISNNMSHRKIHILSIIDDLHFGGDEYRLHAFAQSVDKCRFDHTVLTLMREDRRIGAKYGSMRDQYRQTGIRLIDIGQTAVGVGEQSEKNFTARLLSAWEKIHKISSLIRKEKVDVLDVHLSPANPICAVAARRARIPFTVTLYQVNCMQSANLWLSGQFNLGTAALLITDSESQASLLRRWLMRRPPVCVIPNGTPSPEPVQSRSAMQKLFNIVDRPQTIIGQVSSLVPYKGHLVLLDAAKRVLEQHPECLFLMVGYERSEHGYRESLLQHAASLGIADQVRIVGYPGSIGDVWNLIDIHVHASQLDSLPNALLEAMSLGKPSVITAVGGVPEVVKHEQNGFLVAPNDPKQLAESLLRLVKDPNLRAAIGLEARATYVNRFQPQIMTTRLEKTFDDLVARRTIPDGQRI